MYPLVIISLLIVGYSLYRVNLRWSKYPKLPPGPKSWPIIGNILDLPPKGVPEYQHWLKHKDAYGPISSVAALGQTIVILHDRDAVHELMVKRSLKTLSRPWLEFANNWCDFRKITSFRPYDNVFQQHRKYMHQQFGTKKLIAQYNTTIEVETRRFLLRLLETPENLIQHLRT